MPTMQARSLKRRWSLSMANGPHCGAPLPDTTLNRSRPAQHAFDVDPVPQELHLLLARRRRRRHGIGNDELEAGIRQHLLDRDARMHRLEPHAFALVLEVEDAQRRDAEARSAARQTEVGARVGTALAEAETRAPIEPLGQRL